MIRWQLARLVETLVRPYPPADVTSRNEREEPPEAGGLTRDDIDAIWQAVVALYQTGLHPAITLCLHRKGRIVLDRAIGHIRGNGPAESNGTAAVPATPNTLFNIFSASKAVTAMVIHKLDERAKLHLDDPVCEYLPEFGKHGKEWVTIRHVLTHRAGIPSIPGQEPDLDLLFEWDRIIELLCEAEPMWVPGRRLAYHALTGGFILGEVVRRITGKDIRTVLNEEIRQPLGMRNFTYGAPPEDLPRIAENVFTGPRLVFPFTWLLKRALGVSFEDASRLSNDPRFLTSIVPAGNVIATAGEVARFFQMMLNGGELDGVRIFDRRTVRRAVMEQTWLELDLTLAFPVRYGLGFILGGEYVSMYGPGTPHAFGHLGFTNVIAFADPERDISCCLMTSGKPFFSPGLWRLYDVVRQIANRCPRTPL